MTVEGIASEFDVLAATSRYDPCVSGNAVQNLARLLSRRREVKIGCLIKALHRLVPLQIGHGRFRALSWRVELVEIKR